MIKIYILTILILLISYMAYNIIDNLEPFKILTLKNDNCKLIKGAIGVEDLVKYGDFLIGSSDDRGKLCELNEYGNKKTPDGKMVVVNTSRDLNKVQITDLKLNLFPKDVAFHPHGIYLYKDKYLYVINHAYHKGGERVEVFEVKLNENSEVELYYLRSIIFDKKFTGIFNDLIVVGDDDQIFITQYLPFPDDPEEGRKSSDIESFIFLSLKIKLSYIHYCKGNNCQIIQGSASLMNNGITYDLNNNIYVVNLFDRSIRVFKFNEEESSENKATFQKDIKIGYSIDNIEYDKNTGMIYGGIIGRMFDHIKLLNYYKEHKSFEGIDQKLSGGSVIIDPKLEKTEVGTLQYSQLFGISSAFLVNDMFYHGSWIDDGILICKQH